VTTKRDTVFNSHPNRPKKTTTMKTKTIYLIGFLLLTLNSCNSVFFSEPQPVDAKNIFEFPAQVRGVWMEGEDTITIGKREYRSVSYRNESVAKSIADTSSQYILANNKIFILKNEDAPRLTGGFPYEERADTLYYKARELEEIFLGGNTFLRKVGSRYILNIRNDELWWELLLVEKARDGSVLGRRLSKEDMDSFQVSQPIWKSEDMSYYDIRWRAHDLTSLIKAGCFSDTTINLTPDQKIRTRKFLRGFRK
jgi:hypothetical protein